MADQLSRLAFNPVRIGILLAVGLVVFVLDQLTKAWVVTETANQQVRPVIDGFVRLRYTENTGAAFGLLQGWTAALSIVAIVIIAAIVLSASRATAGSPLMMAALGLVLGGAIGNLADRLLLGYVRDFIEVYNPHVTIGDRAYIFPVFNLADSAITIGVILIMGILVFGGHQTPARNNAPAQSEESEQIGKEEASPYVGAGSARE